MDRQPASRVNLIRWISSLLLLVPLLANASLQLPPEHRITYNIEKYGSHIGQMHSELKNHNQLVQYKSTTTASGFASLFVRDELKENSILGWQQATGQPALRQKSFNAHKGDDDKHRQNMVFHWQGQDHAVIKGQYRSRQYQLNARKVTWSRQLIPLLMSSELQQDPALQTKQLMVADRGKLQQYSYTLLQNEKIKVAGRQFDTLKFKLTRKDSNRTSYLWLSKQHFFLPIKIEQHKKGKLHLRMVLDNFKTV